ncbi:CadC family transcriptional regulator [Granulicella sp. WH15]|uniref:winged helix-turn-helix domain-containing protein n=1 Tax=Granulicella sp. WH15 TaxID=2602070 RepID=UPI0013674A7F|nr:winged helix-turn-helix domain-containing protein [Granulicella sp. WH15]QHN02612.1 CadC family transcriptional regulator [Granulicella sp. WH15]
MSSSHEAVVRVGFGLYEANLQTGELWKAGKKLKLQSQPFKVLTALLERPGEVVTREELQVRLWGKDSVGDFDHSLGTAINKIREALGDTADNPRFVETLARRGYRFIAPVSDLAGKVESLIETPVLGETLSPLPTSVPAKPWDESVSTLGKGWWLAGLLCGLALIAATVLYISWPSRPPLLRIQQLTSTGRIAPGMPTMESLPAAATDGVRIFVPEIEEGRPVLSQVDVHTGDLQRMSLPQELPSPSLGDLSPDGSTLLLRSHLSPESEQPLWLVPTSGGSALRLANVVGHDATWMPDGKSVLFATGNQLIVNRLADGGSTPFATLPGRAFWMRWSPDGKLLRFTLMDPIGHTLGLWEAKSDGKGLRRILDNWSKPGSECCGVWTGDGRYFVFQADRGGSSDLWRMDGKKDTAPVRVTDGPLNFAAPVSPKTGRKIFFLGLETQSVLQIYNAAQRVFVPAPVFLAQATRVEYTRDRGWVLWTDGQGRLWRAHADGSERIQVTPDSLQVFLAHWSPDGHRIALMAREPGKAWQIYLVGAEGGAPDRPLAEKRNAADPSWSADGQQIVFGRVSDVMGKEEGPRALEVLDLRTHHVTTVPGSEGLFSPRWSPDGRYIAALSLDQSKLLLFDTTTDAWRTIADTTAADPVWSADGKAIYFHASLAETQPIYRISVPEGKLEQIANLASFAGGATADYFFCGLTAGDVPIVRSRTGTGNLYSINLEER